MNSVRINLWECMTSLQGQDKPNSEKAEAFVKMAGKAASFCPEISAEVDEYGTWVVELHGYDADHNDSVKLTVDRYGGLRVKRVRETRGRLTEERVITFD